MSERLRASVYLGPMNGSGSKAQLIQASDGKKYVVKLIGNPQGTRILANECFVGKLAEMLGVPSPQVAIIDVDQSFVERLNELTQSKFKAGPQFASSYVVDDGHQVRPSTLDLMGNASNVSKWPNTIVLDTLVQNEDLKPEHILISTDKNNNSSQFLHVDYGHCLGVARGWLSIKLDDVALKKPLYFDLVVGQDPFADAFQRLKGITSKDLDKILGQFPLKEWEVTQGDIEAIVGYIEYAKERTQKVILSAKTQFRKWD